jgi:carbamoylphosphate synthase large subunit
MEDALAFADEIGYPVIVRPAYTLGGTGGGIAATKTMLLKIGENGLRLSPINQILLRRVFPVGKKSNSRSFGTAKIIRLPSVPWKTWILWVYIPATPSS